MCGRDPSLDLVHPAACRRCDAPNRVTDIIGNQQRAAFVDSDADGPAHCSPVRIEKIREYVNGHAGGPAVGKMDKDHLVTTASLAVPRAMLAYEHAVLQRRR